MQADYPVFYAARVVLETRTLLSISTGRGDGVFDSALVRDANGLPAIPGSSFAGVLRHLYRHAYGEEAANDLFGYTRRSAAEDDSRDKPSQVHVSWGCIHDSKDRPVEGLQFDPARLSDDPLLVSALQAIPVVRRHVRLTGRGAAAEAGQFDRTGLHAGHRFSVELSLWSKELNDPRWEDLLCLLELPAFRLGGATRRGLGAVKVVRLCQGKFYLDARNREKQAKEQAYDDLQAYSEYQNSSLEETKILAERHPPFQAEQAERAKRAKRAEKILYADIHLMPRDGYRFGQGTESLSGEPAKLLSVQEKRVVWDSGKGGLSEKLKLVIPASSVKGALSHRLAFHHNALTQQFADKLDKAYDKADNPAVQALFGYARDDKKSQKAGQAGQTVLDDVYLVPKPEQAFVLQHNGIDRFTGGVRRHVLFNEELVGQKDVLKFRLTLIRPDDDIDHNIRTALHKTLEDLIQGRLALGAGGGRAAHGFFSGEVKWSDNGAWIENEDNRT
ncbi:MAG: hypothetical protein GY862_38955 [Gammaproteobacteria bacterium]|nr:hypothetical protein [Gammaproteobacteria bacterium]